MPIRRSITPDFLICLDDGKQFKSLRRHLTSLGLTPAQYRQKWNLPSDYPMTAPNYAAQRSAIAKTLDLASLCAKPALARVMAGRRRPSLNRRCRGAIDPAARRFEAQAVGRGLRPYSYMIITFIRLYVISK